MLTQEEIRAMAAKYRQEAEEWLASHSVERYAIQLTQEQQGSRCCVVRGISAKVLADNLKVAARVRSAAEDHLAWLKRVESGEEQIDPKDVDDGEDFPFYTPWQRHEWGRWGG